MGELSHGRMGFLKTARDLECFELDVSMTSVFNKILSTGTIPQLWKDANVTPIFKKGKKSSPGNYRSACLISVICKLMESLVCDHIVKSHEHIVKTYR